MKRTSALLTLMSPAAPKPLRDAGNRQLGQRMRHRAGQRRDGEQRDPDPIDPAVADNLAQCGQRQQRDRDGELIGVDHPDRLRRRHVEIRAASVGSARLAIEPSSTAIIRPSAVVTTAQVRAGSGSPSCSASRIEADIVKTRLGLLAASSRGRRSGSSRAAAAPGTRPSVISRIFWRLESWNGVLIRKPSPPIASIASPMRRATWSGVPTKPQAAVVALGRQLPQRLAGAPLLELVERPLLAVGGQLAR